MQRQHSTSPPPVEPIHNYHLEYDTKSANFKSFRTNVSDSANYSDEDDEDEIKVRSIRNIKFKQNYAFGR
jgi:hypothetical protein